jgi:hypothetical protein
MSAVTQEAAHSSNPKGVLAVLSQGINGFVCHFGSGRFIKAGKTQAVEARKARMGADPQIAIVGLFETGDLVLGQIVLGGPAFDLKRRIVGRRFVFSSGQWEGEKHYQQCCDYEQFL